MTTPSSLFDLVERFGRCKDQYHASTYNETQLRREFVDPFFEALGWDVANQQGYAEAYKDVVHNWSVTTEDGRKEPDYAFRIGGTNKFFVEAKKPSVNVRDDIGPALQLRRYAWNQKLGLGIVTDFEEFAIYDCRIRPKSNDKATTARLFYCTFDQYPQHWEHIAGLFSKQAVLRGSFDAYADNAKRKRGTETVDDAFLDDLTLWRVMIAKSLQRRNDGLSHRDLNHLVGTTIDRLIFLRIAEDRDIEPYGRLRDIARGPGVYKRICDVFQEADQRYNSGLFHFSSDPDIEAAPDALALRVSIDDDVLREILTNLYYPQRPYDFRAMPVAILGAIYEQFLGQTIEVSGRSVTATLKPAVRKAGGVYYTPDFIVRTVVSGAMAPVLAGKTPRDVSKLKICDPSCGSGSFLLGTYEHLLAWHLAWYQEHLVPLLEQKIQESDPRIQSILPWEHQHPRRGRKTAKRIETSQVTGLPVIRHATGWRLSTAERKRILLSCIYGVDKDADAVEVTKLSLLLKVLEGESDQSVAQQLTIFKIKALPDLSNNIKRGNSLVGTDFYRLAEASGISDQDAYDLAPFDWPSAFPRVFDGTDTAGFAAIVGNPPYIRIQHLREYAPLEADYITGTLPDGKPRYATSAEGNADLYVAFIERALDLLRPDGRLGYITSNAFLTAKYGRLTRSVIASRKLLMDLTDFTDQQVFPKASTYTCLLHLWRSGATKARVTLVRDLAAWRRGDPQDETGLVDVHAMGDKPWQFVVGGGTEVVNAIVAHPLRLGHICDLYVGLQTSCDPVFVFETWRDLGNGTVSVTSKASEANVIIERDICKLVIRSGAIGKHHGQAEALVLFPYTVVNGTATVIAASELRRRFPKAWAYLHTHERQLRQRENGRFDTDTWYTLYPKNLGVWEQPKLMIPYMVRELSAYADVDHHYFVNVTTGGFAAVIKTGADTPSLWYLSGLLNSHVLGFYHRTIAKPFQGGYRAANKQYLDPLPIAWPEANSELRKNVVPIIEQSASELHRLHKELDKASVESVKQTLRDRIAATDAALQEAVATVYGLDDAAQAHIASKRGHLAAVSRG